MDENSIFNYSGLSEQPHPVVFYSKWIMYVDFDGNAHLNDNKTTDIEYILNKTLNH